MTIPEIRLAPPTVEQQQQYHTPLTTMDPHRLPSPDQRTGGSSLHVMTPSPSINSTTTDYDCFVSARQSPELIPTLFDPAPPPMLLEDDDEEVEQKHMPTTQEERNKNNTSTENTRRWYAYLLDINQVLFPTLQEWGSKSYLSRISSLVAMPLVLVFTLTLPVAEAEDVKVDEVEVMMIRDDDDDYVYHTSAGLYPPQPPQHHYQQQQQMEAGQRYYYSSNTSPISSTTAPPYHHHQSYGSFFTAANDGLLPPTTIKPSSSSFLTVPTSESDCLLPQQQQQQQQHLVKAAPSLHSELLDVIDADLQQGWCRWLVAVQAVLSTTFLFCVLVCKCVVYQSTLFLIPSCVVVNEFIESHQILIGVGIGVTLSSVVLATTRANEPPSWFWMLSFVGFAISLNWIFLLANAMVGLLQVKEHCVCLCVKPNVFSLSRLRHLGRSLISAKLLWD
jgi:hypothetical protein